MSPRSPIAALTGEVPRREPSTTPTTVPITVPSTAPATRAAAEPALGGTDTAAALEARAGMQRAVSAYVDAVSARNIGDVVRTFPSMGSDTRRSWETLFSTVPSVEAHAASVELQAKSSDAGAAQLSFSLTVTNPQDKHRCTQTSKLRLQLARSGADWHIVDLRQLGNSTSTGHCG